ncbi:hypothetical protein EDE15_0336 [Edaphobacter aggregans]|uniref:Uncharacterized protein n=1 Tax=Edaphobacter aggregans TaxID=570835 RepID=A0A3R9Q805_9BACT|nr:hypothetical protein EDE15_0336 [Edaphobacter aggregans]
MVPTKALREGRLWFCALGSGERKTGLKPRAEIADFGILVLYIPTIGAKVFKVKDMSPDFG